MQRLMERCGEERFLGAKRWGDGSANGLGGPGDEGRRVAGAPRYGAYLSQALSWRTNCQRPLNVPSSP